MTINKYLSRWDGVLWSHRLRWISSCYCTMYFANELICYGRIMMVDKKEHYELFNRNQVIIGYEVCKGIYC